MKMKKTILRTSATIAVLGAMVLGLTGLVEAAAPDQYGWWYRLNDRTLTGLPAPEPPNVPERGMFVGRDAHPEEALGMSAMNFDTASGTSAVLELTVAPDYRQQAMSAEVVACPTSGSFATEFGALWQNRPQAQCEDGKVMGEAHADGSVMTWELPDAFMVFGGFWSFVLVPDCRENAGCEEGNAAAKAPFQVAFEEPDEAVFSVQGQDQAGNQPPPPEDVDELDFGGDDGGGDGGAPPPGGSSGGSTGGTGGGFGGSTGGGSGFDPGSSGSADDDSDAFGGGDVGSTDGSDEGAGFDSASAPTGETDDGLARIVAIIVLGVLGAGLWLASGFMARRPATVGLGAAEGDEGPDEGEPGGLGRFVRRRISGPRGLR